MWCENAVREFRNKLIFCIDNYAHRVASIHNNPQNHFLINFCAKFLDENLCLVWNGFSTVNVYWDVTSAVSDFLSCVFYFSGCRRKLGHQAPPPTTHSPCGKTWSTNPFASTGRIPTPSTPSTSTVRRSWPAQWLTRSGCTPWPTSPWAPLAAQSWARRTSAALWPAWRSCPPRGSCCWALRTGPSGYWRRENQWLPATLFNRWPWKCLIAEDTRGLSSLCPLSCARGQLYWLGTFSKWLFEWSSTSKGIVRTSFMSTESCQSGCWRRIWWARKSVSTQHPSYTVNPMIFFFF